jgi:hypothetical protein
MTCLILPLTTKTWPECYRPRSSVEGRKYCHCSRIIRFIRFDWRIAKPPAVSGTGLPRTDLVGSHPTIGERGNSRVDVSVTFSSHYDGVRRTDMLVRGGVLRAFPRRAVERSARWRLFRNRPCMRACGGNL